MQKDAKGVDPHPIANRAPAGAINITRPDDHVWDAELPAKLSDELLLFDLGKTIGFGSLLRMLIHRAGLIEQPSGLSPIAINRKRTDADESPQAPAAESRLEKVACRDNRVHEGVRERLLA